VDLLDGCPEVFRGLYGRKVLPVTIIVQL
jgi:hypothetical protein